MTERIIECVTLVNDYDITMTYDLHYSQSGTIRTDSQSKTLWTTGEDEEVVMEGEPLAYLRYLVKPLVITGRGSSGNPVVTLKRVKKIFGDTLKPNTLEALDPTENAANADSEDEEPLDW